MTRRAGSFTFEECLAELVQRDALDVEAARAHAMHREELDLLLSSSRKPS
jgi:Tfp pilus assembly pilus retraction ATPase PilT